MATRRQLFFYVDLNEGILRTLDWAPVNAQDVSFILRDTCVLCLNFKKRPLGAAADVLSYVDFPLPTPASLYFTLKSTTDLDAGTALVFGDATDWNISGDWSDAAAGSAKQCVRLNFNTAGLEAVFDATTPEENLDTFLFDIEMLEGGETAPTTLCIAPCRVRYDVRQGAEGDPAPTSPTYVTTTDLATAIAALIQVDENGDLWAMKNGERVTKLT